jgi:anaerobic magnesium-protoporphyrin IX monomethyl ester cyclase
MTKTVNVLFINFPGSPVAEIKQALKKANEIPTSLIIPLGILYLSSNIKSRVDNVNIQIIDYAKELAINSTRYKTIEELLRMPAEDMAADFTPDILAYSMMFSTCHPIFNKAVTAHKKIWPAGVVIAGGNHATNAADVVMDHPDVDYVARGECELAFPEFIKNFQKHKETITQGFYSREHILNDFPTTLAAHADNLDDLEFPDWELLDMENYVNTRTGRARKRVDDDAERREISIMTNRGCPFSCTFCAAHTTMGKTMRFRSKENVIAEMEELHSRYKINLFTPEDDLFTASRKKVLPLLKAMKEFGKNVPNYEIQFPNALSVNTLFDDVMDALMDAGMKVTNVAVESGSKYVQRNIIKKNCNLDRALEVIKYFRERGVIARCFFISGFPGETKELMEETVSYAKEIQCDWAVFNVAAPVRGTEMYRQFVDAGHIKDDMEVWSSAFFLERIFDTPEIGAQELKDFSYRANLEVNFLNNPNYIEGNWEKTITIFKEIVSAHKFHVFGWYILMKCYENLGRNEEAAETSNHILDLIKNDERSAKMYSKYGYLLEDIYIEGIDDHHSTVNGEVKLTAPVLGEKQMRVQPLMANTGSSPN